MEEKGSKMDRRSFFLKAGKVVIPTLGILGLSLVTRSVQASCTDCSGDCKGTCFAACNNNCSGTCSGTGK